MILGGFSCHVWNSSVGHNIQSFGKNINSCFSFFKTVLLLNYLYKSVLTFYKVLVYVQSINSNIQRKAVIY